MNRLIRDKRIYRPYEYQLEADFESQIVRYAREIFGETSLYLDVKKRIGRDIVTIPDAYVLDFAFQSDPRLYIIENELVKHDPYRHIGQQLLKFAISYKETGRRIKKFLSDEILKDREKRAFVDQHTEQAGFRNLDVLLDELIFEKPVAAVVVIDESTSDLEKVLSQLTLHTDIIEFATFITDDDQIHLFTPFQSEVREVAESSRRNVDVEKLDTIVVPAREDGFQDTFLGEERWYAIRMSSSMIDRVKYIAGYQTAPISAVTHYAEVASIEKWKDTNKYVVNFKESANEIGPLPLPDDNPGLAPQAPRYTSFEKMVGANNLSDIF